MLQINDFIEVKTSQTKATIFICKAIELSKQVNYEYYLNLIKNAKAI
jgi:hypothetical protein